MPHSLSPDAWTRARGWGLALGLLSLVVPSPALAEPGEPAPKVFAWHGNGTGAYAGVRPPLRWSKEQNVLWATAMPSWSNASAVPVGDYVFVTSEPTLLLCLDARTGKILWQRSNEYIDSLEGDALRKARVALSQVTKLEATFARRHAKAYKLKRKLRKQGGAPERFAALERLEREANELRQRLVETDRLRPLPNVEFIGHSSSTPISDGESVYALFANGVLASYDLSGRRNWIRWLGEPSDMVDGLPDRHAATPLLVGETLIVPYGPLRGVNRRTGEILWTAAPYENFGTPVHLRLGGVDVVGTPAGGFHRVKDGALLAEGIGGVYYAGPVAAGDWIYFVGQNDIRQKTGQLSVARGFRLLLEGDRIRPASAWKHVLSEHYHYNTPAWHDGRLYSVSVTGELRVHDATSGAQLTLTYLPDAASGDLQGGSVPHGPDEFGTFYSRVTVAGGHLFLSGEKGVTLVLTAGPQPEFVARNEIGESLHASPSFAGSRLFLRGADHLYCIEERAAE